MYSYKTPIKKAQPNFLQTTKKPEVILTLFITLFTISFLLLSTSSASVNFCKLPSLDKMILLAVKVPNSNKCLIFPSILFTDNQWQEVVFEKYKKAGKSSQQRNKICLRTTVETPSKLFPINFHCEASCFVIFRYKCTVTQGIFQLGLWKSELL